jgi:hypothetical protein
MAKQFVVTAQKIKTDEAEWVVAWEDRALYQARKWHAEGYHVTVRPVGDPILETIKGDLVVAK